MKLQKAVALRVCKLLNENELTRYAFCKKTGIVDQTIKHIVDERNKDIKLSTIHEIADGFDLTLEEFFADELFSKNNLDL